MQDCKQSYVPYIATKGLRIVEVNEETRTPMLMYWIKKKTCETAKKQFFAVKQRTGKSIVRNLFLCIQSDFALQQ